jgi:thiol:disulfide interchange protein DsbA
MRNDRRVVTVAACLLALSALMAQAAAWAQTEGVDYRPLVPAQPSASPPGKIEVIEFFSYGCTQCAEFFPLVSTWAAMLPKDVVFRRVPVGFNRPAWINLQRTYFALQASGDLTRLDGKLFQALHESTCRSLKSRRSPTGWARTAAMRRSSPRPTSFGINNLTVEADKMSEDYRSRASRPWQWRASTSPWATPSRCC